MGSKIVAYSVNLLCIGYLLWKMHLAGSQEAPVLFVFYYPVIIFLNAALWLVLKTFGSNYFAGFKQTTIAVLIIALPLYFIAGKI
jgi:hypothetical protein